MKSGVYHGDFQRLAIVRRGASVVDAGIVLAAVSALAIALSGGAVFYLAGVRISATSVLNPVEAALVLTALRVRFGPRTFLAIPRSDLDWIAAACLRWWRRVYRALSGMSERRAIVWIATIAACSLAIKVWNAYWHFGFWTGDDVEIHEMTLATLYGLPWRAWELRGPFYPFVFIYPAQAVLTWLDSPDVRSLVFVGRLTVALWSTLSVWLTYKIASAVFRSIPIAVIAALILAFSKLHIMAGSSELPRAVSTVFVLLAFGWLNKERSDRSAAALAGIALGIAAAMRFSEEIFVIPALFQLIRQRRRREILLLSGSFTLTALLVISASDWIYWGRPLASLRNILEYTLVQGQSSRGYQPWYEYAAHVTGWSNVVVVGLALYVAARGQWIVAAWTWMPVLLLSALPHKEPRYLIPVLPFLSMSAAVALWRVITALQESEQSASASGISARWSAALLLVLTGAALSEAAGFRFVRSESAVRLAESLSRHPEMGGGAVEQLWRMGGRLYFSPGTALVDLDPGRLGEPEYVNGTFSDSRIRWAVINANDQRPEPLLIAAGFYEVELPAEAGDAAFRLFVRR